MSKKKSKTQLLLEIHSFIKIITELLVILLSSGFFNVFFSIPIILSICGSFYLNYISFRKHRITYPLVWNFIHYGSSITILFIGCLFLYAGVDFASLFFVISAYIFVLNTIRKTVIIFQKTQQYPVKRVLIVMIIGNIFFAVIILFTRLLIRINSPTPIHVIGSLNFWVILIGFGVVLAGTVIVINSDQIKWWALKYRQYMKGAHRLSIEDVFANTNRLMIIDLLSTSPGVHFNEIQRQCKMGRGQLIWHLDILEQYGIIQRQKTKQYTVFFLTLKENPFEDSSIYKKISKTAQDIVDIIKTNPGMTASEISRRMKLHRSTVKYHIDRIKLDQHIRVEKSGRKYKLYID